MKEYKINLYGKEIIIIQDEDSKFIKPAIVNYYEQYGTAIKPAYEPVIVARKPFKTSVVENIMQYGVGGINIDECRISFEDTQNPATNPLYRQQNKDKYKQIEKGQESNGAVSFTSSKNDISKLGRFPANIIHDGSEEAIKDMPNTKSVGSEANYELSNQNNTTHLYTNIKNGVHFNDSGSASRYFYCAKASKKDRDEGLDMFDSMQVNDGRKNQTSINCPQQRGITFRKNIHPTVKPIELMQYLVRLVTPKSGTILDCFMGSGSTGKATMFENRERDANYKFIGIELTEEYLPICEARIEYAINKYEYDFKKELEEAKKEGQLNIFDI